MEEHELMNLMMISMKDAVSPSRAIESQATAVICYQGNVGQIGYPITRVPADEQLL
jgi:hypothetical protein